MSPSQIRLRFASRQIPPKYYQVTPASLGIRPGHPSGAFIAQQAEEELRACMEIARDEMDASQDTLKDIFADVGETHAALENRLYLYVYNTFPLDTMPRTDRALRS